jgi:hypothetical protein
MPTPTWFVTEFGPRDAQVHPEGSQSTAIHSSGVIGVIGTKSDSPTLRLDSAADLASAGQTSWDVTKRCASVLADIAFVFAQLF